MKANLAVVARRSEPANSLDFFPTPPWATQAFCSEVLANRLWLEPSHTVWEPACGEGHMAAVLQEFVSTQVIATDIFPYGFGEVADFLDPDLKFRSDWIITNPPFNAAAEFLPLAWRRSLSGIAFIVRLSWLESEERFRLFQRFRPTLVAVSSERVPMHRGRWEPSGSSATSYAWVVWRKATFLPTELTFVPPGSRARYTKPDDAKRFGVVQSAPLFDGDPP